jgi:hypothetical protein
LVWGFGWGGGAGGDWMDVVDGCLDLDLFRGERGLLGSEDAGIGVVGDGGAGAGAGGVVVWRVLAS